MYDIDTLACPKCKIQLDERQLRTTSKKTDKCPECSSVVRESDDFSWTNLAAIFADEIAEIEDKLSLYSQDSSFRYIPDKPRNDGEHLWVMRPQSEFTHEFCYSEKTTGFVTMRIVSEKKADSVWANPKKLVEEAAKHSLQVFSHRRTELLVDKVHAVWGLEQYFNVKTLSTGLFAAVMHRQKDAMHDLIAHIE